MSTGKSNTSPTPAQRRKQALKFWQLGLAAEVEGDGQQAYLLYTQAHDSVLDSPVLHRLAHEHLRRINWKVGNYREYAEDCALLGVLGPLGFFHAFAWVVKQRQASTKGNIS